jgi:hypothetical protein
MKKILILITFVSLFFSINAHSIERKSGHMIIGSEGSKLYYSTKQKRYISCNSFVLEGSVITIEGYTTALVCDKNDLSLSNLEGVKTLDFSKLEGVTTVDTSNLKGVIQLDGKNELEEFFNSSDTNVSNKNSGDVKGKKLFCYWNNEPISGFGIEFNRNNKVKLRAIDDENEKLITINGKYQALSNKIIIEYKNLDYDDEDMEINRKTLKINYASSSSCKVIKKSSTIEKKLKIVLDKFISQKSSENKF